MFEYHDIASEPEAFGPVGQVVKVWQAKCCSGRVPAWQDFSVRDFMAWHSNIALSEVQSDRVDLRFRFFGTTAASLQGEDFTGYLFSEIAPVAYETLYREHIQKLVASPVIASGVTPAASGSVKQYFLSVVHLPLADDGVTIDRILHVLQREDVF